MRRSKYNVRTDAQGKAERTVDGILFASKKEAEWYTKFSILKLAGKITDLVLQPRFKLEHNGVHICTYVADFQYKEVHTGLTFVADCKGYKTDEYRIKNRLMLALKGITIQEL